MAKQDMMAFTGTWNTGPTGQPAYDCYVYAPNQYTNQACGLYGSASTVSSCL